MSYIDLDGLEEFKPNDDTLKEKQINNSNLTNRISSTDSFSLEQNLRLRELEIDQTYYKKPFKNFDFADPSKPSKFLLERLPNEQPPQHLISSPNATGLSNEFLEKNRSYFGNKNLLEKRKHEMVQNDPVSYGNSEIGLGLVPSLYEGMSNIPSLMFEGFALTKLQKLSKPYKSFQEFSKMTAGKYKGIGFGYRHNILRGKAYRKFTNEVNSWNNFIQTLEKGVQFSIKSYDVYNFSNEIINLDTTDFHK